MGSLWLQVVCAENVASGRPFIPRLWKAHVGNKGTKIGKAPGPTSASQTLKALLLSAPGRPDRQTSILK